MRAPVTSFSKKAISLFFAATLALGLIPAAAFATENEAPSDFGSTVSDEISGDSASIISLESSDNERSGEISNGGDTPVIPAGEIINQEMSIKVVAQAESTRSYFLAQTLESTRTVPVVSASLPLDAGVADEPVQDGEGPGESGVIAADSVVVGSFESDGIVYALEPGGESVALVAVDGSEPFEALVEDGALALPSEASLGDEAYTVTRIAAGAFAGMVENAAFAAQDGRNADAFSAMQAQNGFFPREDEDDTTTASSTANSEDEDAVSAEDVNAIVIPAPITTIEDGVFAGFASLKSIAVSRDNPTYSSYDDCLYTADKTSLLLIPEGRTGAVRIASNVTEIDPEVFSHCPSVDALVADADSAALSSWEGSLYDVTRTTLLRVPSAATDLTVFDGCVSVAEGALEGCTKLQRIVSPASLMSVSPDVFGAQQNDSSPDAVDPAAIVAQLPPDAFRTPWEAIGVTVEGGIEGFELTSEPAEPSEEAYLADQQDPDAALSSFEERASSAADGATLVIYSGDFGGVIGGNGYTAANPLIVNNVSGWTAYGPTSPGYGSIQFRLIGSNTLYVVNASGRDASLAAWQIQDATNCGTVYDATQYSSNSSAAIGAIWSDFTIPVYYDLDGGQPVFSMYPLYKVNTYLKLGAPKKPGYSFVSWYRDAAFTDQVPWGEIDGEKFWSLAIPWSGSIKVWARWAPNIYKISLNLDGGTWDLGRTAFWEKYGDRFWTTAACTGAYGAVLEGNITKTGYTLDGFYTAAKGGGTKVMTGITLPTSYTYFTSDTTLYANWTPNTYTVGFGLNNGEGTTPSNVTATYAANMPALSTTTKPTRTGYDFMGWYDNATYTSGTQYYTAAGASACTWNKTANTTLYAGWRPLTYTIGWNPQGGSVDATGKTSQTFGNAISLPPTPTREGYTFAGWWTEATGGTQVGISGGITQVEARNPTYYAHWNKVSGKVVLKAAPAGDTAHADVRFTQEQVDAFNSAEGDHPIATLNEDKTEVEIPFDVDTKSFSLDLLKPETPVGSAFAGWSPAFVPPSWNATSLSWNNAVTYEATWTTNSYGVTYQDKNGQPLVGWSAWENGPSLESKLPQVFNEATPAEGRALPEKPYKRGYTWTEWTYKGAHVSAIPDDAVPDDSADPRITIVADFTADEYTVKVNLVGGEEEGWPEEYVRDYDDPTIELPADKPKRAGYVFSGLKAYASTDENASAVNVIDTATNASVDTLEPGRTYKVLNLTDGGGNVYDVKVLRAVWTPRIAVDVTPSVDMGILADFGTNTLKFQCGGTDYVAGDTDNAYAPIEFVSYTTAPVGIVAVTDDTQDAGYATRAAFAEKVFGGASNKAKVSFTISSDPNGANPHSFSLGGSTAPSASGFLDGLTIAKPTGAETSKTTPFYLGMDFGDLAATDLLTKESGQIAKLYYTVAILKDGSPESVPSVLAPYDGNGILW